MELATCPQCKTKIAIHADGTATCSCQSVEVNKRFPKDWKDLSSDELAAIRAAQRAEVETHTKKLSSIRLSPAELAVLRDLSGKLGMTYRGRASAAAILHHIASGEALVLMTALDTSGAMRDVASRLPPIAETFDDDICELLKAVSSALWTAADLKQQFEQAKADEIKDDYKDS